MHVTTLKKATIINPQQLTTNNRDLKPNNKQLQNNMNDIDLVYLWVDGGDPVWAAKRNKYIGKPVEGSGKNCAGRYANNDELKYSLRSIDKNAPWIRRIFIVTDGQVPAWLDTTNPKVRIVDHSEIMPASMLPCFNSTVLEHFFHNIPDLSEHFLFSNDDMMIVSPVGPDTFFAADGLPIVRLNWRAFKKLSIWFRTKVRGRELSNYKQIIHNAALLVEKKYGIYYSCRNHHNIDAYLKSNYRHTREMFKSEIDATLGNRVRSKNDIQRNLYSYVLMAEHKAHRQYVGDKTSFCLQIHDHRLYDRFSKLSPLFLCMNDTEHATDDDRRRARAFLETLFPEKSQFEK